LSGLILLGCNLIIPRTPEQNNDENNSVKSSDNEISIVTPENKTYTGPMSGYYPGTYGFENDQIGSVPQGWTDHSLGSGVVEVIQEEDQHKNVLHIQSGSSIDNHGNAKLKFPDLATGTVEYWIKFDNADPPAHYIYAAEIEDNENAKVVIRIVSNEWVYRDGSGYQTICPAEANKWYRLKVDWDLTSDTSDIYVYHANNALAGSVMGATNYATGTTVNILAITMHNGVTNTNIWVDAVGVSWDPNYNFGDNSNEGLLLSFENSTTLDWVGYSLDGLANKTIMGNYTIPIPVNGTHNIQVFGNGSLGAMYASNLRHFTIDILDINIVTPENKTYTGPMSGYYPATYGFESDENGIIPEKWSFFTSYTGFVQVVEEMDGHKKVVELKDAGGGGGATIVSNMFSSQTTGTIECYIYLDYPHNSGDYLMIKIHDQNPIDTIVIYWEDGNLVVYDGTTPTTIGSYNAYTWYHVRVQFDCADDWHLWIDGNSVDGGSGYGFRSATTSSITAFDMRTWSDNVFCYLDAVSYSWDPYYNIGDNFNEGLLLNFENRTALDWMGYSLDGLTNKTILGDTTILFLGDGSHSIQVFGNDSLGTMYESEIRYFSINAPSPSINIITPSNDEFYNNIAPSFSILVTAFYQITTWYTLDGGGTNITFAGSSGTINQTEWDKQGEIPITIRFYVNDSFGRLNYAEITINKDITDPVITINFPSFGNDFTTMPPSFNISVDELNIDAMWYTIDDGLTNYDISQYTGYIDSGAWNTAPNGAITIRFYVRDKAGNINYEDVIVQKSSPPYIPPDYSLIIILSVAIGGFIAAICIILVVTLIRKRRARPPKPPKPPKPARPPKLERKIPLKQERRIVPPSRVIVQREVMVIEKKPLEREKLDTEAEKRTRFEEEKETKQVKCLYCGTYIDYYARICPKCGNEQ